MDAHVICTKIDMKEKGQVLRQSITCLNSAFNFDKGVVISEDYFKLCPILQKMNQTSTIQLFTLCWKVEG